MSNSHPIEVPIEVVLKAIGKNGLADCLEELKKHGYITHFIIRTQTVLVWTENRTRFEVAAQFAEANPSHETKTKKGRLH